MPAVHAAEADRRILGLDGLRGFACVTVMLSHYFGEVAHGLRPMMAGWIAVDIFFVLSGFLIGRLILDKQKHVNFFSVFYMRRLCRLLPPYLATLALVFLLLRIVPAAWGDADEQFPMLAYLSSLQGFWMAATGTIGAHWLAPTWTLAVEEHFYLLTPALIVFTPRRALAPSLALVGVGAILFRAIIGLANPDVAMGALVLLPGRADLLVWGLLAALLHSAPTINWAKLMPVLRLAPLVGLVSAAMLKLMNGLLFDVFGPTLVGAGCAGLILAIVRGAPEAARFQAPALRFLADNGYCLYLIHLTVLGVMHGLVLGTRPDLATAAQWAVTLAAVPVCIFVSWAMTKLIEEPFMAYGRRWKWGSLKQAGPSGRAVAQASRSTAIHKLFKA